MVETNGLIFAVAIKEISVVVVVLTTVLLIVAHHLFALK
jgi:hypothetical protein